MTSYVYATIAIHWGRRVGFRVWGRGESHSWCACNQEPWLPTWSCWPLWPHWIFRWVVSSWCPTVHPLEHTRVWGRPFVRPRSNHKIWWCFHASNCCESRSHAPSWQSSRCLWVVSCWAPWGPPQTYSQLLELGTHARTFRFPGAYQSRILRGSTLQVWMVVVLHHSMELIPPIIWVDGQYFAVLMFSLWGYLRRWRPSKTSPCPACHGWLCWWEIVTLSC